MSRMVKLLAVALCLFLVSCGNKNYWKNYTILIGTISVPPFEEMVVGKEYDNVSSPQIYGDAADCFLDGEFKKFNQFDERATERRIDFFKNGKHRATYTRGGLLLNCEEGLWEMRGESDHDLIVLVVQITKQSCYGMERTRLLQKMKVSPTNGVIDYSFSVP